MLRESNNPALRWADKTLSLLHERQLEASEDRLSYWPEVGLFTPTCTERHVPALWRHSYLGQEAGAQPMCSLKALRRRVLDAIPEEALFLSIDELQMLMRLIREGGPIELFELEESAAAELLMRRLWCYPEWLDEDRVLLHLAPEVTMQLIPQLNGKRLEVVQTALVKLSLRIRSALYLSGAVYAADALQLLRELVSADLGEALPASAETAMKHWLRAVFDYTYDKHGRMILLHPGLAEPEKAVPSPIKAWNTEDMPEALMTSITGVLPAEMPLFEQLCDLLANVVRPELTPNEAAQDPLILAKQGVSLQEMEETLSSMLIVQPTPGMRRALRTLSEQVLPWPCFRPAVIH